MAYYRGDYYRGGREVGDYYRGRSAGDPFWGALLRGIGTVAKAVIGIPSAAPSAAAAASGAAARGGVAAAASTAARALPAAVTRMLPSRAIPAAMAGIGTVARSSGARSIAQMVAAGIIIDVGGRLFNQETGKFVKSKRMNPLNPRALRRSMRRVQSFARFAHRTISFTKRVRMKKRRRAA